MTPLRPAMLALVLAALVAGYTAWPAHAPRPGPVVTSGTSGVRPPAARHQAHELLVARLTLTSAQRAALTRLAADWAKESVAHENRVRAAGVEFEAFMVQAKEKGGASLAEIQARSTELREASGVFRERRNAHTAAALSVLTTGQRQALAGAATTEGGAR